MCKPQEFEFDDLVDHIIELMENLAERVEINQNKLEELKEPWGSLADFMRPWDA